MISRRRTQTKKGRWLVPFFFVLLKERAKAVGQHIIVVVKSQSWVFDARSGE